MIYGPLNESINLGKTIEKIKKIFNKSKDKKDKIKKEFEDKQDDVDDAMSSIKGITFSDDGNVSGKYYVANTSEITKNLRNIEDPKKFMLYYFIKDEITPYVNDPSKLTEDKAESIYNKVKQKRDSLNSEINNIVKTKREIKKYLSTTSFSGTSLDASKKIKDSNSDMNKLLDIIKLIDKKYQSCFKEDDNFWGSLFKLANFTTKGIDEDAWYLILEIEELEMEYYYNYTALYYMLANTYYNGISDSIEKNVKILDKIGEGSTNESAIECHEECASIEEYIDSLDEFAICDIDREYITEGLSSVLNKIKASAAATKKKLKDKADKIKKEWQKNNELNSYSAMVNGSYFTNLKVTIDDYIELPSFYDAFANSQDVLDDLTYIFETAWKKIVNIRKENSKYTDYNAALKDLNKIKADVDKQYAKFDIDGRMEEVFGLDGKASQHTINNKDVAALISSYQAVGTSEEEVMWLISKAIAVVDDELDDLSSMTEDYQKQLDKSGNDDEKSRLKYLIDSVDTLTEIEKSTSDAMGDYINIFNKCAREYQNLIEKYLDKVDVDAEKQIKK